MERKGASGGGASGGGASGGGASGGGASSKKADEALKMNQHLKAILKDQEKGEYSSF
jgi:hypothetical protein